MPTDNRITIRLQPHQIRHLHILLKAIVEHPGHVCLLDLRREHVDMALGLLERIPDIVPQQSEIHNKQSAIQ